MSEIVIKIIGVLLRILKLNPFNGKCSFFFDNGSIKYILSVPDKSNPDYEVDNA